MMKKIYHVADAILCGLGNDTQTVVEATMAGQSCIQQHQFENGITYPVSKLTEAQNNFLFDQFGASYSRFEQMCLFVINQALHQTKIEADATSCIIILSSTKGNIAQMGANYADDDIPLHFSAKKIGQYFKNPNAVAVVSVACISGVAAQIMAKRLLENNIYQHAIIVGCDELSLFVLSGFHSFQALSAQACKPFDENRNGLNLGEAAVCMILSNDDALASGKGILKGGAITNDANHLSGPSKTGQELGTAILQTMNEAQVDANEIDFVSAHGTATNYNDEMEAKAIHFATIKAHVNSLKANFGHTLGASGLLETVVNLHAMANNTLLPTLNFENTNVSVPVEIIKQKSQKEMHNFVKTAAGFGGCNAAILWSKI